MEPWFLIALLCLALLISVTVLVHHVRLVRALKRLLFRLLSLGRTHHAVPPDPIIDDPDPHDRRLP